MMKITTMIRSKLEYVNAEVVCSPQEKHMKELRGMQRTATKMIPEMKNLTYGGRLKEIQFL